MDFNIVLAELDRISKACTAQSDVLAEMDACLSRYQASNKDDHQFQGKLAEVSFSIGNNLAKHFSASVHFGSALSPLKWWERATTALEPFSEKCLRMRAHIAIRSTLGYLGVGARDQSVQALKIVLSARGRIPRSHFHHILLLGIQVFHPVTAAVLERRLFELFRALSTDPDFSMEGANPVEREINFWRMIFSFFDKNYRQIICAQRQSQQLEFDSFIAESHLRLASLLIHEGRGDEATRVLNDLLSLVEAAPVKTYRAFCNLAEEARKNYEKVGNAELPKLSYFHFLE